MIPRHYHFVFGLKPQTKPFHLTYYLCLRSCLEVNEPDAVTLYYHYEPHGRWWRKIRRAIRTEQVPLEPLVEQHVYVDPELARYRYAHHADFVRLRKLAEHGGVYADIDTIFVRRPPEALFGKPCVLGAERAAPPRSAQEPSPGLVAPATAGADASQPPGDELCNALIMGEPGSAFCTQWLADLPRIFDGSWSAHSCSYPAELRARMPEAVHVEPPRSFYAFDWSPEGLRALLEGEVTDLEGIYSIHLWDHLWASKGRRDFSHRNHRELTPRYVRKVDTTYNLLARRYL